MLIIFAGSFPHFSSSSSEDSEPEPKSSSSEDSGETTQRTLPEPVVAVKLTYESAEKEAFAKIPLPLRFVKPAFSVNCPSMKPPNISGSSTEWSTLSACDDGGAVIWTTRLLHKTGGSLSLLASSPGAVLLWRAADANTFKTFVQDSLKTVRTRRRLAGSGGRWYSLLCSRSAF